MKLTSKYFNAEGVIKLAPKQGKPPRHKEPIRMQTRSRSVSTAPETNAPGIARRSKNITRKEVKYDTVERKVR